MKAHFLLVMLLAREGRVLQNLQKVREAVRYFVDTYNREWLAEQNGCKSPWQARAKWLAQASLARVAQ
ncbi:MAG: hypothetical protein KKD99_06335 [Proteobacteria bacterium]|nr:hypothetical protein [Pseudomonadota bacterium]MBU4448185.1 hypothetical protein [Pseudomonadota bacterium]